jgi:hypothetical protein
MVLYLIVSVPGLWLLFYAESRCTRLDVAAGRRDAGALVDDYGSNRGWHWPWSPIVIVCSICFGPGLVMMAVAAIIFIFGAH